MREAHDSAGRRELLVSLGAIAQQVSGGEQHFRFTVVAAVESFGSSSC